MNKRKKMMVAVLQKIAVIGFAISFIFVFSMHEIVPVTPFIMAFDVALAIKIISDAFFVGRIIKTEDEEYNEYYNNIYDIITLSILIILGVIILLQYPPIYNALLEEGLSFFSS